MHLTGLCMHALHALSHDVTGRCMQLLPRALLFWFRLRYTFISSYFGFMVHTANLVVSVSYVSGRCKKKHFEKQALVAGTKQSRQAIKAGRLTRLAGWQGSPACLLCFVPALFVFVPLQAPLFCLEWMFYKLICIWQSNSLRYLWLQFLFCYFSSTISPQA